MNEAYIRMGDLIIEKGLARNLGLAGASMLPLASCQGPNCPVMPTAAHTQTQAAQPTSLDRTTDLELLKRSSHRPRNPDPTWRERRQWDPHQRPTSDFNPMQDPDEYIKQSESPGKSKPSQTRGGWYEPYPARAALQSWKKHYREKGRNMGTQEYRNLVKGMGAQEVQNWQRGADAEDRMFDKKLEADRQNVLQLNKLTQSLQPKKIKVPQQAPRIQWPRYERPYDINSREERRQRKLNPRRSWPPQPKREKSMRRPIDRKNIGDSYEGHIKMNEAYRRIITILSEITAGHGKGAKFSDSGGLIGNVSSSKRQRQHPSERTKKEGRKARVKRLRSRHTERAGTQKAQGDAPWSGYDKKGTSARYAKIGNKKQAPIDWDKIKSIKSTKPKSKISSTLASTPEETKKSLQGNIDRNRAMKAKIGKPK